MWLLHEHGFRCRGFGTGNQDNIRVTQPRSGIWTRGTAGSRLQTSVVMSGRVCLQGSCR